MDSVQKSDVEGNRLVVGIDFGSADSYVGYISKGSVDIVQNEVSQRKTPSLVGFTERERLLGDAALSQIKSNTKNTCRNFKHLLGHKLHSPEVEKEHFWATSAVEEAPGGSCGFGVSYKGEKQIFSAVEITAMFFTKLIAITEAWCQGTLADCVIAVPSYFADAQRQALLDAAHIAGLNVLRVMNEHAATALAYGIYRTADFDVDKPQTVAFCTMGHVVFSVAIVQFVRGKLTVVCEKSAKVGGRDMDECLMRSFAAQFQKKVGCDPLSNKKASFKLEDAVMKTKKILSANSEASVSVECLMEDEDFSSNMKREDFLEMCKPMMKKVSDVLEAAKAMCGLPMSAIDAVEMCGGASRVPWVKEMCSKAFGGKELSTTMNADECVARGCTIQAAMLSRLYKVREFKVEDTSCFPVNLSWLRPPVNSDTPERLSSLVFPSSSKTHRLKLVTFHRQESFELKLQYADDKVASPPEIGTFVIEVPRQATVQKVKVKVLLSIHGTHTILGAQLLQEDDSAMPGEDGPPAGAEPPAAAAEGAPEGEAPKAANGDAANGKRKAEGTSATKKRYKRTDLKVVASSKLGLTEEELQKGKTKEEAIQADMREIIETDALKNDLEAYILDVRNGLSQGSKYHDYAEPGTHEGLASAFTKAEEWLWDHADDGKQVFIDKLAELKKVGDPIVHRARSAQKRDELVTSLETAIASYAKRAGRSAQLDEACKQAGTWLKESVAKQAQLTKHVAPALDAESLEKKIEELSKLAADVPAEGSPAPAQSMEVD